MDNNNEAVTTEQPREIDEWVAILKDQDLDSWTCPYCDHKPWPTHQARNNHIRFMHSGQPIPKMTLNERKARHAIKLSRGWKIKHRKPLKRSQYPSHSAKAKREKYYAMVDRYAAQGLNAHGEPYKLGPEAVKRIQQAQWNRRLREDKSKGRTDTPPPTRFPRKPIEPIVYHAPKEEYPINYCPKCGTSLEGYRK